MKELGLQRYSIGGDGYRRPSMVPNSLGDYYKASDVENLIERIKTLAEVPKHIIKCGHKVEIKDTNGIAHTYCGLDVGHEGKCE